jgi:hypothetical protein
MRPMSHVDHDVVMKRLQSCSFHINILPRFTRLSCLSVLRSCWVLSVVPSQRPVRASGTQGAMSRSSNALSHDETLERERTAREAATMSRAGALDVLATALRHANESSLPSRAPVAASSTAQTSVRVCRCAKRCFARLLTRGSGADVRRCCWGQRQRQHQHQHQHQHQQQ